MSVPVLLWNFENHENIFDMCMDSKNNLYIQDRSRVVKKLSPTGDVLWEHHYDDEMAFYSDITIDDKDNVLICTLTLFEKVSSDNVVLWSYTNADNINSVSFDPLGNVYIGGQNKVLTKLSSTGTKLWEYTLNDRVLGINVDSNNDIVVLTDHGGLTKLTPNKEKLWDFLLKDYYCEIVFDDENTIYITGAGAYITKIYSDGTLAWEYDQAEGTECLVLDSEKNIIYSEDSGAVKKLTPDGDLIWATWCQDSVYGLALDSKGNIYAGDYNRTVVKISPEGMQEWQYTGPYDVTKILIDTNDDIYCSFGEGHISKLKDESTEVSVGGAIRMKPYIKILPHAINACNDNLDDDCETSPLYHVIVSQDKLKMMFLVVKRDELENPKRIYDVVRCEYISLHGMNERDEYLQIETIDSSLSADCTLIDEIFKTSIEPYGINLLRVTFHDFEFFEADVENKGFTFDDADKYEKLKELINKKCLEMMLNPNIRE